MGMPAPPARPSSPALDERPPEETPIRSVPAKSPDQAWREKTDRSIGELHENDGRILGELARIEGRIARAGTALIIFALVALLPHLGHPVGWYGWAVAHPKEMGAAVSFLLVLNSVMPRGEKPAGGLPLVLWTLREWVAFLDRRGWFGKFKVGVADYDKSGDEAANSNGAPDRRA